MDASAAKPSGPDDEPVEPRVRVSHDPRIPDPEREARWAAWRAENAAAIASSNAWVAEHGLPLAKYRQF